MIDLDLEFPINLTGPANVSFDGPGASHYADLEEGQTSTEYAPIAAQAICDMLNASLPEPLYRPRQSYRPKFDPPADLEVGPEDDTKENLAKRVAKLERRVNKLIEMLTDDHKDRIKKGKRK